MMRLARIGTVLLVLAALALSATPCLASYTPYMPEYLVRGHELIALFEVVRGNVTPDTIFEVPKNALEHLGFHVRPMVTLEVVRPLKGCAPGDSFQVPTRSQPPWMTRQRPVPPLFLNQGQRLLGYLDEQREGYILSHVFLVEDEKLRIELTGQALETSVGWHEISRWEEFPVEDGARVVADAVRLWNEAQAYQPTGKTATQLIEDYGDSKWLNDRIIEELVARGDAVALDTLLEKAGDPAGYQIIRALGRIPGPAPVPHLIDLLSTPYPIVRCAAIQGLARPEARAAVPRLVALIGEDTSRTNLTQLLPELGWTMAAIGDLGGIAAVLQAAAGPDSARALPRVIDAVATSSDARVDALLIDYLRTPVQAWAPPSKKPVGGREGEVRRARFEAMLAAAKALTKRGNDAGPRRLVELLLQWLEGESSLDQFASRIMGALGELRDQRTVPLLLEILAGARSNIEWSAAADALVAIRDERAVEPLIALVNRTSGINRADLVRKIGVWDHPEIKAMLTRDMNGDDRGALSTAALALHKLGSRGASDRLLALLDEGLAGWDPDERRGLYSALHKMSERRAVPGLIAAMRTDSENRSGIGWMLREITGADLPDDPELWQNWWDRRRE